MVRQITREVCFQVVALRNNGVKQREIARQYRITQGAVSKILKRNAENGIPTPRPRPGRPLKTTRRQDRLLVRMCLAGRMKSANTLRREWQNATNLAVSRAVVNRRLVKAGYRARRMIRKPLLTQVHRQRRRQWARDHLRWQPQHWNHVVFSDEARFQVYRHDGRIRVRRRVEELYHEECIEPRVQAGGGGITVWAAFHAGGKTDLVFINGHVDRFQYLNILATSLLPFARATFQNNFVFQDDNAPAHRARVVSDFLEEQDVEHMIWPACSPDMNPIEHLWAELTRILTNLHPQPTNVAELRQAVTDAWELIPLNMLRTLAEGMPRRVEALQAARGGHTRY